MAAIALKRGGSFSSHSGDGSSDYGGGAGADNVADFSNAPVPTTTRRHTATHATSTPPPPTAGGGLYGSSLASLEYQYHDPHQQRRHSLARNESQSTMGDDLSLMGECDNNSIRSDRNRPGRRASLSAAIEMTRSPPPKQRSIPKRSTSGHRKARRNSLFGNNNHKDKEAAAESLSKLSNKAGLGSRRASMAGYPATGPPGTHTEEPEPTPQFFHSRKKDKQSRSVPNRLKTRSFDKTDTRITSQLRPGGKIKRPGKGGGGGRRASMGALPSRLGLSKSGSKSSINSKGSNRGSNRSLLSSNSGSSSYDISDDEEYYGNSGNSRGGGGGGRGGNGGAVGSTYRRTVTAPTPQRSFSYGAARAKRDYKQQQQQQQESAVPVGSRTTHQDLGYGDPEEYDPQLPPPPPPGTNKQKMFVSRRGSTGTAVSSFPTNSAAQRSLKESIQWKKTTGATMINHVHHHHHNNNKNNHHHHHHHHRGSNISSRRVSADSVATSVATDKVNNTAEGGGGGRIIGGDVIPPPPPPGSKRVPTDVPSGCSRRVPADVPPGGAGGGGKKRVPVDMPPQPTTPQQSGKHLVNPLLNSNNAPRTPLGVGGGGTMRDDSESSHSYYSDHTPLQSNRRTTPSSVINHNSISAGSALGSLMGDESDGSHGDGLLASGFNNNNNDNMMDHGRRASRGLSVLQTTKAPLPLGGGSSLMGGSSLGGGFNLYGNKRDSDDEEEDEDENDDEEETEEDRIENQKMADFGSEAGDIVAVTATSTTTDTTPTLGTTTTSTEGGSIMDLDSNTNSNENVANVTKGSDNKDDDSVDSMTSEAPQEKGSAVVDVDDLADQLKQTKEIDPMEEIGATGDWSGGVMEEIGATGDWSGGVKEELLHQPRSNNSLLDRYPGSDYEYGYEGADLGYGYSHLGQPQQPQIMNAYDDESERKDDYDFDNGYGPSDLYDEDYSSFGWREHLPRAADSMEFINMEQLMSKAKNTKGLYLPTFIPAHGCTQASDYIVRCFVARLRAGMNVTKHSRSRFCKSHDRILHILPTGYHITWIPEVEEEETEKEKKNKIKKPPTKLDLTKCLEVRHAWSRDPKSMKYTGTSTLRSKCKEGAANRSFALIYPHRTVDFTAMTVDQCKILMEGFSALCFRLQMAKLEQQSGDDETTQRSASIFDADNDSTTASLTGTNMSAPWGL